MAQLNKAAISSASKAFSKPESFTPSYGTAGFRAEASVLSSTVYRCGLLVAMRALITRKHCGIMITASHNPIQDNGVKLVEPGGEMMPQSWEPIATELAQCSDEAVTEVMAKILQDHTFPCSEQPSSSQPCIVIGYDTRPSGPSLVLAAQAGISAMGLSYEDAGQVTTPQLHFMVHALNHRSGDLTPTISLPLYFDTLVGAFEKLVEGLPPCSDGSVLHVDCAHGVGAQHLAAIVERLQGSGLTLKLHNTGDGKLNHGCGADFVQKDRVMPSDFEGLGTSARCCSIDGDADRLVFFYPENTEGASGISLLDGDKIATLAAAFIRDLLDRLPDEISTGVKVGIIQTAYANGASTSYIQDKLGLPVECTPTGVKFLHEAAHHYDVGVYWEANGHGTVLFSAQLLEKLEKAHATSQAARELLLLSQVINQTVGDAMSGILLVEAVLRRKAWSLRDWAHLYQDLPSRQSKLKVADRAAITTTDAERRCVTPAGLQDAIDQVVSEFPSGSRSFVRPSGTEDAVRVYAEAPTQDQADDLAVKVSRVVYDMAGGVGQKP